MKLNRIATVAGLLTLVCGGPLTAQSPRPAGVGIVPFAGWAVSGSAGSDNQGPVGGAELTWRRGNILWTPLEISALFPTQGGYVNLASGVAVATDIGHFVGLIAGVSRFSTDQRFIAFRAGVQLPSPLAPLLEVRLESHDRHTEGGSALSVTVRLPIRVG